MSEIALLDRRWITRGVQRASAGRFALWLAPWFVLLFLGAYAAGLCFFYGLNQTNMDNRFAFGLWIFADLSIIAMGAGAFFTGFLVYILKQQDLKPVLNSAVVVGFICYSGAVAVLMVDVGQPLRAWFTFWYPNTHSMLTEVTFCISCYLLVLILEYIPLLLKNRQLRKIPAFLVFEHQFHKLVPGLAGVGAFLSFFHQGSLGGLYGVLRGRPFAYRQGLAIWPSTFFLFILSALAVGPSFLMLVVATAEKVTGKQLVQNSVYRKLGFISGVLLALYVAAKAIDTYIWLNITSPAVGFGPRDFYSYWPLSSLFLFIATVPLGLLPAILMIVPVTARKRGCLLCGAVLASGGVLLNRFVMTVQTLALPTLSFDSFLKYTPSWQEVATFGGVIAYGVIVYSLSYRYLPLFAARKGADPNASQD
ncbi:MAG TPA: NrfD/PsrC family molybdoenzyme membrane anchor subunit [Candidatus Eremiobacteraceae bacterium]|nr:NrfD/PsrC family molybdoenzyme membrane anchor subunit [Candidatus Eremiobacteraceae bacterium]